MGCGRRIPGASFHGRRLGVSTTMVAAAAEFSYIWCPRRTSHTTKVLALACLGPAFSCEV